MAAYIQMGHNSEILVGAEGLEMFSGIILSPVNRKPDELQRHIAEFRTKGDFNIVLDPQLYCPRSERGHLPSHPYFPQDIETTDLSSVGWWQNLSEEVANYSITLSANAVCSPIVIPSRWTPDYYSRCAESYTTLAQALKGSSVQPIMTLCVHLRELGDSNDALRIASIATSCNPAGCYLVIESELEPRREINEAESMASIMVLIAALEHAGCRVLVSHTSSDMLLFKAAGASHCSTGNHFNLRRFTRGRFQETEEGGRQIAYWFEHGLMAFLREADIARLRRDADPDFLCVGESRNLFATQILEKFSNDPKKPWVGLGWRQFLAWFGATEERISDSDRVSLVSQWLREAEERWKVLDDNDVLFEEARNDGSWIRKWRQALSDFRKIQF